MLAFIIDYWLATLPVLLTGIYLFALLVKAREQKANKEGSLVRLANRRR